MKYKAVSAGKLCKEQKEKEDKYISNCKLHHYGIVFDHNALSGA